MIKKKNELLEQMVQQFSATPEELLEMQEEEIAIIPGIIFETQIITIIGESGAGKTLLAMHFAAEMAKRGYEVTYLFEDGGISMYARMQNQAARDGYRIINSAVRKGKSIEMIMGMLEKLKNHEGSLEKHVFFIDTLKKFTSLMNKADNTRLFKLFRDLTVRGATFVVLGHSNKYTDMDGKLVFEGTGDILNDSDALYYIYTDGSKGKDKPITLEREKARAFGAQEKISYRLRLADYTAHRQEQVIDVKALGELNAILEKQREEVEFIQELLDHGEMQQKEVVQALKEEFGMYERSSIELIKKLDGKTWGSKRTGERRHKKMLYLIKMES